MHIASSGIALQPMDQEDTPSTRRRSSDTNNKYIDRDDDLFENKRVRGTHAGESVTNLSELRTLFEGVPGPKTMSRFCKTTLIVTNQTVEIEKDGASPCLTVLTLGFWYWCCRTTTIEIYELQRIEALYLRDGIIIGETGRKTACDGGTFKLDVPPDGEVTTKELFLLLKEAWSVARHNLYDDELDMTVDRSGSDDEEPYYIDNTPARFGSADALTGN